MSRKSHIPAPGRASGLSGLALCGTFAVYSTGDHAAIRSIAQASKASGEAAHYCAACIKRV
jgi:hypothetical protein